MRLLLEPEAVESLSAIIFSCAILQFSNEGLLTNLAIGDILSYILCQRKC